MILCSLFSFIFLPLSLLITLPGIGLSTNLFSLILNSFSFLSEFCQINFFFSTSTFSSTVSGLRLIQHSMLSSLVNLRYAITLSLLCNGSISPNIAVPVFAFLSERYHFFIELIVASVMSNLIFCIDLRIFFCHSKPWFYIRESAILFIVHGNGVLVLSRLLRFTICNASFSVSPSSIAL